MTPCAMRDRPPDPDIRAGLGAGAVGGYAVMRIDPAIVADEVVLDIQEPAVSRPADASLMTANTIDDVRAAFGG